MDEHITVERTAAVWSPSGRFAASVSSRMGPGSKASTQVLVEDRRNGGGSGLLAVRAARVPFHLVWTSDLHLLVRYPEELPQPRIDPALDGRFCRNGQATYESVPGDELPSVDWHPAGSIHYSTPTALRAGRIFAQTRSERPVWVYDLLPAAFSDTLSQAVDGGANLQGGGATWAPFVTVIIEDLLQGHPAPVTLDDQSDCVRVTASDRRLLLDLDAALADALSDPARSAAVFAKVAARGLLE